MNVTCCHICGTRIPHGDIHRRQMCTAVTYSRRWDHWRSTYRHARYELVSLCPRCDAAEAEHVQREQQCVITTATGLVGLSLLLLLQLPFWWSVGFLVTVRVLGLLTRIVVVGIVLQAIVWSGHVSYVLPHNMIRTWVGVAILLALWTLITRWHVTRRQRQKMLKDEPKRLEGSLLTIPKKKDSTFSLLPPPHPGLWFPNKEK